MSSFSAYLASRRGHLYIVDSAAAPEGRPLTDNETRAVAHSDIKAQGIGPGPWNTERIRSLIYDLIASLECPPDPEDSVGRMGARWAHGMIQHYNQMLSRLGEEPVPYTPPGT